jgi:hypothetical protein
MVNWLERKNACPSHLLFVVEGKIYTRQERNSQRKVHRRPVREVGTKNILGRKSCHCTYIFLWICKKKDITMRQVNMAI